MVKEQWQIRKKVYLHFSMVLKDSLWCLKYKLNIKFEKEPPHNVHSRYSEQTYSDILGKTNRSLVYLIWKGQERRWNEGWGWEFNWELDTPIFYLGNIEVIGDFDK